MKIFDFKMASYNQIILLKIFIFLLYACNNAMSKYLTTNATFALSSQQVIFYHYSIAALMILPYAILQYPSITAPKNYSYHLYRIALSVVGVTLLHNAFRYMTLAEAVGLQFLGPAFSLALAYYGLRERITYEKIGLIILALVAQYSLFEHQVSQAQSTLALSTIISPVLVVLCFQLHTYFTKRLTLLNEHPFHLTWGIFFAIPLVLSPCLLDSVAHLDIFCWGLLCIMAANALIAIIALNRAIALSDISIFIPLGLCKYAILYFFDYVIFHKVPSTWHTLGIVSGIMCIVLLRQALQRQHQKEDTTDFNTA